MSDRSDDTTARELAMGTGWADPSEKARTRGLSRRAFMKESGLASLAAAGGATAAAGCLSRGDDSAARVGYIPITDAAPLLTAYANDHFADAGVTAAEPTLFRGWSDLAEAFFAGDVNIAHFLMPMTVWMRYNLEEPVKVVAWDHTDGSALTVHDGIDAWTDLGGGRVAVPFWYSIHNVVLQIGLREHGLTPRTDDPDDLADDEVELVVMPPPDMPAALSEANVDGYIVAEPFNAIGELEANAKILRFTGDIWRRHACCVVVMREELLEDRPAWARDAMDAIVQAQQWLRTNREAAATLLSDEGTGLLPYGSAAIDRAMNHYDHEEYVDPGAIRHPEWGLERIDFYPYPYPSYTEELVRRLQATRVEGEAAFLDDLEPGAVAEDLVAYEPVRSAVETAGGPEAFDVEEEHGFKRDESISL